MNGENFQRRRPEIALSWAQRAHFLWSSISLAGSILSTLVLSWCRGSGGAQTYGRHVGINSIKSWIGAYDAVELQYMSKTCDQVYLEFCEIHGINPNFVTSETGLMGFWLGSKNAKRVALYLHGGGFHMDILPEHLQLWHRIQADLARDGREIAVFFAVYTLCPHAAYPTQVQQAAEALNHLLGESGRRPQDVLLAGDSAGGNLCLSLVSHLSHPMPDVPRLDVDGRLRGMILLSPWVSFDNSWPSMKYNYSKDITSADTLEPWSKDYLGGRDSNNYAEPVLAPVSWWSDAKVDRTLVATSSDEMFFDPDQTWAEAFKSAQNDIQLFTAKGEFHCEAVLGPMLGYQQETQTEHEMKSWLKETLKE